MTSTPVLPDGWTLVALDSVGSTNDEASRLADAGAAEGTVVWAREQTGGRGRRGRHWSSPVGNLYSSTVLRPDCAAQRAAELGFVAALAVADIVPAGRDVRLKWPNDVLVDGGKVAGILLESSIGQDGLVEHVVAGIGDECGLRPAACPRCAIPVRHSAARSRRPWKSSRRRWPGGLPTGATMASRPCGAAWLAKAGPLGADVDVRLGEELVRGRFAGLDGEGALLLDTTDGPRKIVSGELLGRAA